MDPLSQGVLGASLPQSVTGDKSKQRWAFMVGFLSGMAPDLDILIQSPQDPLLFLEYHRQFTHSLFFIPFGGLLCTLILYPFLRRQLPFGVILLFACLGYGTHGLLDSCTSYGTQLFWPISDYRVSWNNASIIDPLFTLPMLALMLLAFFRRQKSFARLALIYGLVYLSFGVVQRERVESAVRTLADSRGHHAAHLTVKPTFGNLFLWKSIYEYKGQYFVDGTRVAIHPKSLPGRSIRKLDVGRDYPWLDSDSTQAKDIKRFRWFSDDYLAVSPDDPNLIIDVRYSFIPNDISPLWGIRLDPERTDQHVDYVITRSLMRGKREQFLRMLFD